MRICIICNEEKSLDEFVKRTDRPLGRGNRCKPCEAKRVREIQLSNPEKYDKNYAKVRRIARHGLSIEQYNELIAKHDGLCWVCLENEATDIDHNHECCPQTYSCGECVRGMLCGACNRALGIVEDKISRLERMIDYLGGYVSG